MGKVKIEFDNNSYSIIFNNIKQQQKFKIQLQLTTTTNQPRNQPKDKELQNQIRLLLHKSHTQIKYKKNYQHNLHNIQCVMIKPHDHFITYSINIYTIIKFNPLSLSSVGKEKRPQKRIISTSTQLMVDDKFITPHTKTERERLSQIESNRILMT